MQAPRQARNDSDAAQTDTARTVAQKRVLADNRPEAVAQRQLAEMMNNSPRVLQQRALSDAIDSSLRMVAQRHAMHAFSGGAVKPQGDGAMPAEASLAQREEKTNNTGLPNHLKSGIESLSGMSMDHVKVHYNSDKPAQLQAHAYAQGNEIHLGAGQERHLPHEAWHVVQQAQGRVRPTLQMKAGAVNDDPSLESEADRMGEKAAQFKCRQVERNLVPKESTEDGLTQYVAGFALTGNSPRVKQLQAMAQRIDNSTRVTAQCQPATVKQLAGSHAHAQENTAKDVESGASRTWLAAQGNTALVQRRVLPFPTRDENDPTVGTWSGVVEDFVGRFNTSVTQARALSCNWRALSADGGYVASWIQTAQTFFQDPSKVPSFLYARFGYAVETLACNDLPSSFRDLTVHKQYAAGATRPDIVLKSGTEEIAWIDITAEASCGHIMGKDHGGWRTRPFVYEILYDSLNLNEILGGRNAPVLASVGEYYAARSQISAEESEKQRLRAGAVLIELKEKKGWTTGTGVSKTKLNETKTWVERKLGINLGSNWKKNLKGLLAWAEVSNGPYGFNKYRRGQETSVAKHWGQTQADPHITDRQAALNAQMQQDVESLLDENEDYDYLPFVLAYKNGTFVDDTARIATALAVMAAAPYMPQLQRASQQLAEHDRGFDDLSDFKAEVDQLIDEVPQQADLEELNSWVNHAAPLLRASTPMIKAHVAVRQVSGITDYFEGEADWRARALLQRIEALERFPAARDPLALDEWADETEGLPAYAVLLRDTLQAQRQFIQYMRQKYARRYIVFVQTPAENNLLLRLSADPVDNSAILASQQYINRHPLPLPQTAPMGGPLHQAPQSQSNAMDTLP